MSLRRLAQANNATIPTTPRKSDAGMQALPITPTRTPAGPSTPRTKLVYPQTPMNSQSLSASIPFDWEAARSRKPPPYKTPLRGKRVRASLGGSPNSQNTPIKRVVRKKTLVEKVTSIPSRIAFEIALFPNNVPLPTPRKSAWLIGGAMHALHFFIRVAQLRKVPDSDLGWEDLYREGEGEAWFDWTTPVTILLIIGSLLNAYSLFTRTRVYQLSLAPEPVASPNAKFVSRSHSPSPEPEIRPASTFSNIFSLVWAIIYHTWRVFSVSIRFLFNLSPPKDKQTKSGITHKIQQLEVWTPGELELILFAIYSPVHPFLWMGFNSTNWMLMGFIMVLVGAQMRALTRSFEIVIKDKAIIQAEVMHEYDEKFVNPRINPIRRDAAVMTHEAEVIIGLE